MTVQRYRVSPSYGGKFIAEQWLECWVDPDDHSKGLEWRWINPLAESDASSDNIGTEAEVRTWIESSMATNKAQQQRLDDDRAELARRLEQTPPYEWPAAEKTPA